MATIEFKGIDAYIEQLKALDKDADKAIRYAIYPGADVVADEIKAHIPVSDDPRSSGDLAKSMVLTPMVDRDGFIFTQVKFAGYDSKGVPNQLIARVLESGRSGTHTGKHPFIRPVVNQVKKRAQQLMDTALNMYLQEKLRK